MSDLDHFLAKCEAAEGHVVKANDEDRFLLMVAYSPHRMPLRGKDGRTDVVSPSVLEKACWQYRANGLGTGMWHEAGHGDEAMCVENSIYRGPDWDVHKDGSLVVKAGDWLVGFVLSPHAWSLYKAGKIGGVSLDGRAGRKKPSPETLALIGVQKASERAAMTIGVSATSESQLQGFARLCKAIQWLGSAGCSRTVQIDIDGDGAARFRFEGLPETGDLDMERLSDSDVVRVPGID